jgi:hypothetical protein
VPPTNHTLEPPQNTHCYSSCARVPSSRLIHIISSVLLITAPVKIPLRMFSSLLVVLAVVFVCGVNAAYNASSGICGYQATCTAGGRAGVCVSIGSGCCNGGAVTAGLCPGKYSLVIFLGSQ